jgi:hypothetical protein
MTLYGALGPAIPSGELEKGETVQLANGWDAELHSDAQHRLKKQVQGLLGG